MVERAGMSATVAICTENFMLAGVVPFYFFFILSSVSMARKCGRAGKRGADDTTTSGTLRLATRRQQRRNRYSPVTIRHLI